MARKNVFGRILASGTLRRAAIVAGLMAVFAAVAFLDDLHVPSGAGMGFVRKVIDGDTIILDDGRHVRYSCIDCPETDSSDDRKRALAHEATALNRRLVLGRQVRLEFDVSRRDRYGRTLAYVYVDDTFVQGRLVEEGLAEVVFYGDNRRHLDDLRRLEDEAKAAGRGLWAR